MHLEQKQREDVEAGRAAKAAKAAAEGGEAPPEKEHSEDFYAKVVAGIKRDNTAYKRFMKGAPMLGMT